ncbi:MAG TPA: cadherin repeat domain-containing protein, partial [Geobacteraceae bacterium]
AKDWTTVPGKGARSRAKDAESCVFSCYVEHDRAFDLIVTWYAAKSVQCLLKKPQEGPLCAAKLVLQLTIKLRDLSQKTDKCVEKCFCMDDPICGMPTGPNPPSSRSGGAPGMARAKSGETCDSSASSGHVCPPAPRDPNEKDGPAGYSTEAFVGVQQPWLYTIHFENVSNATAYARQVFVTDKMDPNLDLRTFRLREVAFGDVVITVPTNRSFFQTRVPLPAPHASNIVADVSAGVDLGKGEVFWTINAIDLTTGELVANALEGILPPNDATHRGEGYVVYTVKPKASANTGTVVTNQARIVFDTNEPIDTNPTRHTVDAVAPTSTVGVLPAIAMETNFPVSWAGTDDQGGAGLATYDIYVSDNSGPWQVWLSSTAGIGAIFNGQPGHQYAFFSRARDHASNLEPLPAGLQAATVVSNNRAPSLAVIPNQTATVGQDLALQLSASDPDEPAGFTFDLLDCPTGASIDSKQGILHWVPQSWQAATTNLITVQVRDHGFPPKSASQSFLVVVDDYTELTVNGGTFLAGQSGCLPVRLISTRALANLSFVLSFPVERLQNLAASPAGTDISQARLGLIAPGQALITLSAAPGATLKGTQEVASVCFQAVPGQASGVVPLGIGQLSARTPDGATVQPAGFLGGSLTIIGTQPLLELAGTAINQVEIIVHGYPGKTYVVETASDLHGPWSPGSSFTLSTVTQLMSWPIGTDRIRFLRVREQPGLRTREATEITNGE